MRILHTADWHLGKTLARRNRDAEHAEALERLRGVIEDRQPDVLLVAGDIFDSASPPPEAERQLNQFLRDLAPTGVQTVMIAGNHDNPRKLAALRPLAQLAGVHVVDRPAGPCGAVIDIVVAGERLQVGCVPYVTDRYFPAELEETVRVKLAAMRANLQEARARKKKRKSKRTKAKQAEEVLFGQSLPDAAIEVPAPDTNASPPSFAERARALMALLAESFADDSVHILMGHLFMGDARPGGGERDVSLDEKYRLSTRDLPAGTHYVALGHIHRPQLVDAGKTEVPVRYSGSLLQLAFSEESQEKSVVMLEAEPGAGIVDIETIPFVAGRGLRDVAGTCEELQRRAEAGDFGDDFLRVTLLGESWRPGLSDEIREFLPEAVHIHLAADAEKPGAADLPSLVVAAPRAERDVVDLYRTWSRDLHERELSDDAVEAFRSLVATEQAGITEEEFAAQQVEVEESSRRGAVVTSLFDDAGGPGGVRRAN